MSLEHPEWGEDRIALELALKLGVRHSPATVRKYRVRGPGRGPSWRQFLASHGKHVLSLDFTTQPLWHLGRSYVLVVMALDSREVLKVAVGSRPTLAWVKQHLGEGARDAP